MSSIDDVIVVDPHVDLPRSRRKRAARLRPLGRRAPRAIAEGRERRDVRDREISYRRVLALVDALAAGVVVLGLVHLFPAAVFNPVMLVSVPFVVVVAKVIGLYERDELVLKKSTLDEAPVLLQLAGLFTLIAWMAHDRVGNANLEGAKVMWVWTTMFVALFVARTSARRLVAGVTPAERCLVVGDWDTIQAMAGKLSRSRANATVIAGLPVSASQPRLEEDAFRELVRRHGIERVIIAPVSTDAEDTLDLIRLVKAVGVRVSLLPRLFEVVGSSVEFDNVDGLTMLGVRRFGLTRSSLLAKRAFDLVGSTLGLVVLAPLFAAIGVAIRLDSRGPIFFRQTRVGCEGRHFEILKFRSMSLDAEERKADLLHLNETSGVFKISDDPRVTRVGRFLRKMSLDELPQLINVWRGDMSLVGPRPLVVAEDARVAGYDRARLALTPGMTGHWQILGSARVPMEEMVGIDYLYVANWSLWTDVKILVRTVPYVLRRRGM